MSEITITPDFAEKTAAISGRASAGEKVSVVLKNCAALNTPTLRLRVLWLDRLLAVHPAPAADGGEQGAFEEDGDDLVCTLNLCTVQAMKTFRRVPELEVMFILDDVGESVRQMHFRDFHTLLGWPQNEGTDVPVDLGGYVDRMKLLSSEIAEVREDLEDAVDDLEGSIGDLGNSIDDFGNRIGSLENGVGVLGAEIEKTQADVANHALDNTCHLRNEDVRNVIAGALAAKTYDLTTLDGLTDAVVAIVRELGGTANEE